MKSAFSVTSIINSCTLLQFGNEAILTDPYFTNHWYWKWNEPIGMEVSQLPRLSAIIGGHSVFDHWQISALDSYDFKRETPVFVATKSMARKARATGFTQIEVLEWNDCRRISDQLSLEAVPAQHAAGLKVNNYVLSTPELSIFFGSEALDLEPLRQYRLQKNKPRIDIVLVPVNGAHLFKRLKLVMTGTEAVEATRILGAKILVPIHDSQNPVPLLFGVTSSADEATDAARKTNEIKVVRLTSGEKYTHG